MINVIILKNDLTTCHEFFGTGSNCFIFSDSVMRLFVYFWGFPLIKRTGRNRRGEEAAPAWWGGGGASCTHRRCTVQMIRSLTWLHVFSRWKPLPRQSTGVRGKEENDKGCPFLKSHLFTKRNNDPGRSLTHTVPWHPQVNKEGKPWEGAT